MAYSEVATGSYVTACVNAAAPQLFIDIQLSIHCSYNHMFHLPYILETFEPAPNPPPPHLQYNHHHSRKSISIFAVPKLHATRIFYSLWLLYAILCIHNALQTLKVHSSNSVHSGKRKHPAKYIRNGGGGFFCQYNTGYIL